MTRACVVCGCTQERACVTEDGPCSWADEHEPLCSACAAMAQPGTAVEVRRGKYRGRHGVVVRAPARYLAYRYLDLAATTRAKARTRIFVALKDLAP